jgi:hypothetical protein
VPDKVLHPSHIETGAIGVLFQPCTARHRFTPSHRIGRLNVETRRTGQSQERQQELSSKVISLRRQKREEGAAVTGMRLIDKFVALDIQVRQDVTLDREQHREMQTGPGVEAAVR